MSRFLINSWDKFEGGLLLGLGMINMDTQPLVPYWDLFNQALPLNQESKYSLFVIFVPSPHMPILSS